MADINKPLPFPEPKLGPKKNLLKVSLEKVPEKKIRGYFWSRRWSIIRHALIGIGLIGAYLFFIKIGASENQSVGWASLAAVVRKLLDDASRSKWGKDLLGFSYELIKTKITRQKGVLTMGDKLIRDEVKEAGEALADAIVILFDETPNKEEFEKIAGKVFSLITEGKDLAGIPKNERMKAALHTASCATNRIAETMIKYSDEVAMPA